MDSQSKTARSNNVILKNDTWLNTASFVKDEPANLAPEENDADLNDIGGRGLCLSYDSNEIQSGKITPSRWHVAWLFRCDFVESMVAKIRLLNSFGLIFLCFAGA